MKLTHIICWKSNITGKEGRGDTPFTKAIAQNYCAIANKNVPDAQHWIEEYKPKKEKVKIR